MAKIMAEEAAKTPEQREAERQEWERRRAEQGKREREERREHLIRALLWNNGLRERPRYFGARLEELMPAVEKATPPLSEAHLSRYRMMVERLEKMRSDHAIWVLSGSNGPGKTFAAAALVNAFCLDGRSAFYSTAHDFFMAVKACFGGEPGRKLLELDQRFQRYELLVIDEFEKRSDSDWENNLLHSLLDARYARELATVLVTNKDPKQLHDYVPLGILDRIREGGGIVHCDWPSLRGRGLVQPTYQPTASPEPFFREDR